MRERDGIEGPEAAIAQALASGLLAASSEDCPDIITRVIVRHDFLGTERAVRMCAAACVAIEDEMRNGLAALPVEERQRYIAMFHSLRKAWVEAE